MTDVPTMSEWDDAALLKELRRLRAASDGLLGEPGSPELRESIRALGAEREHRRVRALVDSLRIGETTVLRTSVAPGSGFRDLQLHEKRRRNLEEWARKLGIPLAIPPGTDLSIHEVYDEFQVELYSLSEYLRKLREKQKQGGGRLGKMDTLERFIEALRRAMDSEKLSAEVREQLSSLLSLETLKWLPFLVGLGMGLGMLGGAGAFALLVLVYGPAVLDLIEIVSLIANAETEEEFEKAVQKLTEFIASVGVDIITTIGGAAVGSRLRKAGRGILDRMTKPADRTRRPRRRRKPIRPTWPDGSPRSFPRKRPPWHDPKGEVPDTGSGRTRERPSGPSPRRRRRRRRSGEASALSGMPKGYESFDHPANVRKFAAPGRPQTIIGKLSKGNEGRTDPFGRIILRNPRPRRRPNESFEDFSERVADWLSVFAHELAHRRLRPFRYPPEQRSDLGRRIDHLLKNTEIVGVLDEVYAYSHHWQLPGKFGVYHTWTDLMDPQFGELIRFYGVNRRRAVYEWGVLVEDPYFRRLFGDRIDDALEYLDSGEYDLAHLVKKLEEFYWRLHHRDLGKRMQRHARRRRWAREDSSGS